MSFVPGVRGCRRYFPGSPAVSSCSAGGLGRLPPGCLLPGSTPGASCRSNLASPPSLQVVSPLVLKGMGALNCHNRFCLDRFSSSSFVPEMRWGLPPLLPRLPGSILLQCRGIRTTPPRLLATWKHTWGKLSQQLRLIPVTLSGNPICSNGHGCPHLHRTNVVLELLLRILSHNERCNPPPPEMVSSFGFIIRFQ